jgi:ferredoxin
MGVEVSVDPELCIGSGECVRIAPLAFVLDDAAGVSLPTAAAPASDPERLLEAARSCPTQAIRLVRDGVVLHESN